MLSGRLVLLVVLLAVVAAVWTTVRRSAQADAPQPAADGNYLRNPGFETAAGRLPAHWVIEKRAKNKGEVQLVPSAVPGGQVSLKLTPNDRNDQVYPLAAGQGFPIASFRGKRLRLAGKLAAEGEAVAVIGLYAVCPDGRIADGVRLHRTSTGPGAVFKEGWLEVPSDDESVVLVVSCSVEGQSGAAIFDDVYLGEAPAVAPSASMPAPPSPVLSAEVTVDASRRIRTIPRTLYGTNVEWIFDGYGIWDRAAGGFQGEILDLTRDLKLSLIRFPGGVFSDFYDWRKGIGPAGARQSSAHLPGGPKSVHAFGTDEALAFARAVGGRLLITVNAGTGTADEAAAWVRYVNHERATSDQANRVEYWEVGNELYGKGGAADHVTLPPARYADRFLRFAEAMRAADPDIRIGAIGGENFGLYLMNGYPDWNRVVLGRAGDRMDFLAVHNAYAPMVFVDRGDDVRTVYAAMLAAPILIAENLATLSRQIDDFAPRRASAIKIAVTEWGPWFQADPNGRFVDHVKTLGSALFVASTLKTFIESPRTEIANAFKLVDNAYLGWIGPSGGRYAPKAPCYAMQMYTRHFGRILVHSRTESPTYDSVPVGLVAAVPNVPYLDVLSSLSEDGRSLYLMAVNKHFDAPITATIRIRGFAPAPQARTWTLNGTGIDAHTGTELPAIPGIKWGRQAEDRPWGRFRSGAPGEVAIAPGTVGDVGETFAYTFPAHSVTAIEIRRAESRDAGP